MSEFGSSPDRFPSPTHPEVEKTTVRKTQYLLACGPSRPVRLDDVLDGPPADGTARVDLPLELQPAVVAQAHVAAGVDDRVHLLVEADGAFSVFASRGQLRSGDRRRDRRAERGAGSGD